MGWWNHHDLSQVLIYMVGGPGLAFPQGGAGKEVSLLEKGRVIVSKAREIWFGRRETRRVQKEGRFRFNPYQAR